MRRLTSPSIDLPRLRLMLVVLAFLFAQVFGVIHLAKHAGIAHGDRCDICDTAAHLGSAILPAPVQLLLPALIEASAPAFIFRQLLCVRLATHAPRAPPAL